MTHPPTAPHRFVPPQRPVLASDSGLRGTGEPAARPAGAAPPRGLAGIMSLAVSTSLDRMAETAWRGATREQLQELAERMAAIDPEKALAASALLSWAVAGKALELPIVKAGDLPWVYLASRTELRTLAAEIARLSPQAARILWVGLGDALEPEPQGNGQEHSQR